MSSLIQSNGLRVHYRFDGPEGAPVLVLSNSLGTTLDMWAPQIPVLAGQFRVLRCDTRGHGETEVPPGPYRIDQLGNDVVGLLDALSVDRAHFCGISMGGLIGQWLGIHAPHRLHRLIVSNTAARIGTTEGWQARAALVREKGMAEVAAGAPGRWFTEDFLRRAPEQADAPLAQLRRSPPSGYAACCDALASADLRDDIARIPVPTLALAGAADPVTTPADARFIAERVPGGQWAELPASHLSNVEAADEFNRAVLAFLHT